MFEKQNLCRCFLEFKMSSSLPPNQRPLRNYNLGICPVWRHFTRQEDASVFYGNTGKFTQIFDQSDRRLCLSYVINYLNKIGTTFSQLAGLSHQNCQRIAPLHTAVQALPPRVIFKECEDAFRFITIFRPGSVLVKFIAVDTADFCCKIQVGLSVVTRKTQH